MGAPTSEVGYTPAMPGREGHEAHKRHVVALDKKKIMTSMNYSWNEIFLTKFVGKTQNKHFVFSNFFPKIIPFMR